MNSKANIANSPKKVFILNGKCNIFCRKVPLKICRIKAQDEEIYSCALHWHCFHPSLQKINEIMEKRFSIEELTCLHLLRCHYADICNKEERELRETIALHPAPSQKQR